MRKVIQYAAIGLISTALISGVVCGIGYVAGLRINTTTSIPLGLYKMSHRAPRKGDYVMFCPPQQPVFSIAQKRGYIGSGFCPGGYGEMMKKILAAKGDEVAFRDDGVYVNNQLLPYSQPLGADPGGRELPAIRGKQVINKSDVLLMTDRSPLSFDARYFGLVTRKQIISTILPVLTW